jgi:predicted acylesterase/phospholipase RssA
MTTMKKSSSSFGRTTRRISILLYLFSSPIATTTTHGFVVVSPSTTTAPSIFSTATTTTKRYDGFFDLSLRAKAKNDDDDNTSETTTTTMTTKGKQEITSLADLDECWDELDDDDDDKSKAASSLSVKGDTQIIGSPDHPDLIHPVVRVLHDRKRKQESGATAKDEKQKVALVIEGGGMRGCVTGGMVCAIDYLGLRDCVDIVYGSSAGSVIGAYFITGQLPWFGPEVYYDQLTTAGKSFIDTSRLLRALGLGLLNPKLIKDVITRRNAGKPILDLDYLLVETMQKRKPLDWSTFVERQEQNIQPLRVVASGMDSEQPIVMNYKDGHFKSLEELAKCMHGSCLLPGLAGPVVNILKNNDDATDKPKFVFRNNLNDDDYEPLADALIYAPIPYDVAQKEGATHMIVLRSKPDGGDVIGKGGSIGEKLVWSRFFLRKNKLSKIYRRLRKQLHKRLYAKNILELNEAAASSSYLSSSSSSLPPTLTVAIPPGVDEIGRLEVDREAIFEGVRNGFARAYDALVEDPAERGKGYEIAKMYFPDEILDYSPQEIQSPSTTTTTTTTTTEDDKSAFVTYMSRTGVWPKSWKGITTPPIGRSLRTPKTEISAEEESPLATTTTTAN